MRAPEEDAAIGRKRRVRRTGTRIVCLGGGTGQSMLLAGLAARPCELTAVVGVTDNGGHSGLLRRELGLPAVGDLRNCLGGLAGAGPWARLLRHRFAGGGLDGVSLGNLMLAALTRDRGTLTAAAEEVRRALDLRAAVLPVSDGNAQVCARLADGRTIRGEWEIIRRRPRTPIVRVLHHPRLAATPQVLRALRAADLAVLCPGALFTAVGSVLAVDGVAPALRHVPVLAVINLMTQPGQTDGMSWLDHVVVLAAGLGKFPEWVLVNAGDPPGHLLRAYARIGSVPVLQVSGWPAGSSDWDREGDSTLARDLRRSGFFRVRFADLVERPTAAALRAYRRSGRHLRAWPHLIRHDPARLARAVHELARRLARPASASAPRS